MIEELTIFLLCFDTGLLVLIWLVQLVVYPSLERYNTANLKSWHPTYSKRVSIVVLPLMLGQLAINSYMLFLDPNMVYALHFLFIMIAWSITFLKAVPLHNSLQDSSQPNQIAHKLTRINWYRTIAWSVTWLMMMYYYFSK